MIKSNNPHLAGGKKQENNDHSSKERQSKASSLLGNLAGNTRTGSGMGVDHEVQVLESPPSSGKRQRMRPPPAGDP